MLRSDLIIAGSNFIFSHIKEKYTTYIDSKKDYCVFLGELTLIIFMEKK